MADSRHNEILNKLQELFRELFDDDSIELSDATTAADIDGWDSLTNIRLLVQIEQELGVSFHSTEIADIPNVGELVDIIISKKF